ncbi:heme ABC transporter ATP-binding protein [Sinimarinibacterium sp. CAU 1509]|nr:heme ABC transporter ATP-binding protein [Sinimarinibacterium sp. CAU 1509]
MLEASNLGYRPDGRRVLHDVNLRLTQGKVHAVLGPNGAGKSTLLRLLSGELAANSGRLLFNGRALAQWPARRLAQLRAVLPQREQLGFGFSAEEVVQLGRYPALKQSAPQEQSIIDAAMVATATSHLRDRRYPELSGGERARVQLARVLAQIWNADAHCGRMLLLDEPTASLDLAHQHYCLQRVRQFAASGTAVLIILHDPNLVADYADEVTLLCDGEVLAQGTPADVLQSPTLERMYGVPIDVVGVAEHRWIRVAGERIASTDAFAATATNSGLAGL